MTIGRSISAAVQNRTLRIGVGLYVLSVALRLIVLMELRNLPTFAQCTVLDMRGNHEFALAILQGLRPTTYYKAPFYSYFLAAVYAIAGTDPLNARWVQIFLTSFTPVLTFLIGQRLFGRRAGAVAGLVSSFFWTFLYFSVELLDTGLACLLQMLLAWLLIVLDDRRKSKWFFCGLVLGLGAITRPNILAFAPLLAIMTIIITLRRAHAEPFSGSAGVSSSSEPLAPNRGPRFSAWRTAVANIIALTIGCCLPIAPVTLRNRLVGGEWVLLGAYGGMNLYVANNPYSDSKNGPLLVDANSFAEPTTYDPNEPWARCCLNYYTAYRVAETKLGRAPRPGEFATLVGRMGKDFIRENPGWFARHAFRRLCWMFNTFEFPSNRNLYSFRWYSRVLTATSALQFGMICPFALLGLGFALARSEYRTAGMAYCVGMFVALLIPAALFHINVRFRVPIVHALMPFAGYGLLEACRLFRRDATWARRLAVGAALAGLAAFSNTNLFNYWDARGAHLQWAMVMACEKAGRNDLLPKAVDDLEKALIEFGDTSCPSDTSLVIRYGHPMAWLFHYHRKHGNQSKAMAYAKLMLEKEPLDPQAVWDALAMFIQIGDRQGALQAAEKMTQGVGISIGPGVAADCLHVYGRTFQDGQALRRAAGLYEQAIALAPSDVRFHKSLTETQELLQNATTQAQTRPARTTSPALRKSSGGRKP